MWNKELWLQTKLDRVLIFWNIKFVQIWILLRESNRNRFNTMIRVLYGPFHTTVILQIPYGYKLSRGNKFHGFRWCFGPTKWNPSKFLFLMPHPLCLHMYVNVKRVWSWLCSDTLVLLIRFVRNYAFTGDCPMLRYHQKESKVSTWKFNSSRATPTSILACITFAF